MKIKMDSISLSSVIFILSSIMLLAGCVATVAPSSSSPRVQLDLSVGVLPVPFMKTNKVAAGLRQSGLFKKIVTFASRDAAQGQDIDILVETAPSNPRGLQVTVYSVYSGEILLSVEFVCGFKGYSAYPECVESRTTELIYEAFEKTKPLYAQMISEREEFSKRNVRILKEKSIVHQEFDRDTNTSRSVKMSDVDELPSVTVKQNKNAYAIVIGIEQYRQKLPKADFAVADAKIISEYLTKTMGYPEENVITLLNDRALKSDLEKYFDRWLINNVEENGRVFIYYSGHGAPNTKTGDAYLVPYDGDPTFIAETGYSIARLYESLGKLKAREITVVLDSCFSGAGGRSVLAKGAKPLVMTINIPTMRKNISVMTASSGEQISSAYEEQGHGLFTYFLLKGIKNEDVVKADGSIKMDDLFGYIKPQVERIARKQFNNEQTPQLIGAKK